MIVETAKLDAMQYSVQYELIRSQVNGTGGIPQRPAGLLLAGDGAVAAGIEHRRRCPDEGHG